MSKVKVQVSVRASKLYAVLLLFPVRYCFYLAYRHRNSLRSDTLTSSSPAKMRFPTTHTLLQPSLCSPSRPPKPGHEINSDTITLAQESSTGDTVSPAASTSTSPLFLRVSPLSIHDRRPAVRELSIHIYRQWRARRDGIGAQQHRERFRLG